MQDPAEVPLLNWLEAITIKLLAQLISHVHATPPYNKYSNQKYLSRRHIFNSLFQETFLCTHI